MCPRCQRKQKRLASFSIEISTDEEKDPESDDDRRDEESIYSTRESSALVHSLRQDDQDDKTDPPEVPDLVISAVVRQPKKNDTSATSPSSSWIEAQRKQEVKGSNPTRDFNSSRRERNSPVDKTDDFFTSRQRSPANALENNKAKANTSLRHRRSPGRTDATSRRTADIPPLGPRTWQYGEVIPNLGNPAAYNESAYNESAYEPWPDDVNFEPEGRHRRGNVTKPKVDDARGELFSRKSDKRTNRGNTSGKLPSSRKTRDGDVAPVPATSARVSQAAHKNSASVTPRYDISNDVKQSPLKASAARLKGNDAKKSSWKYPFPEDEDEALRDDSSTKSNNDRLNPFVNDDYDDTMNPFSNSAVQDDEYDDAKNPFCS